MSDCKLSAEVLKEYEHIANWLERESVLLGPVGDTMHALAAEAFWRLLAVAKGHHRTPQCAMFDEWLRSEKATAWQEGYNDSERSWKHIYDGHDTTWENPETCVSCVTRNPYKEEA